VTRDAEDLFNAPGPVRIEEQRQAARAQLSTCNKRHPVPGGKRCHNAVGVASHDFVFDECANGHELKYLTVVDQLAARA
jgi:hypothetical protein